MTTRAEAKAYAAQRGLRDPVSAYDQQRGNAVQRGIAWEFDFASWWEVWRDWYHLRGRGKNQLCMARNGDVGPYAPGNVFLTTNLGNALSADRSYIKPLSDDERIARQHRKGIQSSKWKGNDRMSHMAWKSHCKDGELEAS